MENILKEMTSFFKLVSDAKGDDVVFLSMMVDKKEENISVALSGDDEDITNMIINLLSNSRELTAPFIRALSAIVSEEADAEIAAQDIIRRTQDEG